MPEIEPCPFCDGACKIRSSTSPFYVNCSICSYASGLVSTKSIAIAVHNKFCIQLQRAEQLEDQLATFERFAELAVPIVKFTEHYFDELDRVVKRKNSLSKQCTACLAARPENR